MEYFTGKVSPGFEAVPKEVLEGAAYQVGRKGYTVAKAGEAVAFRVSDKFLKAEFYTNRLSRPVHTFVRDSKGDLWEVALEVRSSLEGR